MIFRYRAENHDVEMKGWILADYSQTIWQIKVIMWNDLAKKYV